MADRSKTEYAIFIHEGVNIRVKGHTEYYADFGKVFVFGSDKDEKVTKSRGYY